MAGQQEAGTLNDDQAAQLTGFSIPDLRRLAREGHVTRSRKGTYHLVRLVREIVDYLRLGIVTTNEAAALLGLGPERVRQLAKHGHIRKIGPDRYQRDEVVRGYLEFLRDEERRSSKTAAESRVRDARAAEIELRVAERRGALIAVDDAVAVLDVVVSAANSELLGLPARITRERQLRRKVEQECDGARQRLSDKLAAAGAALAPGGDLDALDAEGAA